MAIHPILRFALTSLAFLAGLAACLFATDRVIGRRFARKHGEGLINPDVYIPVQTARAGGADVRIVYLGDSVARQLFKPGTEPSPNVRFLTSNQAISMAGQYYLLREACGHFPNLREVYLLYFPLSLANDLGPPFTNDYFCGYFHDPAAVADVFELRRDFRLTSVHVGRMLMPNLLAANSAWQPMMSVAPPREPDGHTSSAANTPGAGSEPLLDLMNRLFHARPAHPMPPDPPGDRAVFVSPVSAHYLAAIRALCASRGLKLHVLPCPCSDLRHFDGLEAVYDASPIYVDQTHFVDTIHLQKPYVDAVRNRLIETYHLDPYATEAQADVGSAVR